MKKWYRIYELLHNLPVLTDDSLANWFDNINAAETMIEAKIRAHHGRAYTIITIYEKEEK